MTKTKVDIYRSREKARLHDELDREKSVCPFCDLTGRAIDETPTMVITKNKVAYDWWDEAEVIEHLMLIPKRHVETTAELNQVEREEYLRLIAEYEKKGYSFYSRSLENKTRTQPHLHTHLIKTGELEDKFMLIMRNLGIRFVR